MVVRFDRASSREGGSDALGQQQSRSLSKVEQIMRAGEEDKTQKNENETTLHTIKYV